MENNMWNVYKREWVVFEWVTYFVVGFDLEEDAWEEAHRLDETCRFSSSTAYFVRYEND